jgi:hypothetical protein
MANKYKKDVGDLGRRDLGKYVTYVSGPTQRAARLTMVTHDLSRESILYIDNQPFRVPSTAKQAIEIEDWD